MCEMELNALSYTPLVLIRMTYTPMHELNYFVHWGDILITEMEVSHASTIQLHDSSFFFSL